MTGTGATPNGQFTPGQLTALRGMSNATLASQCTGNPLLNVFGSAAVPGNGLNPGQIVTVLNTSGGSDNGIIKVDVHLNDKNSLNFDWYSGGGNSISAAFSQQYWSGDLHTWANMGRAVWIWTPSSSWLNEFRFGYEYGNYPDFSFECDHPGAGPNYAALGLNVGAKPCGPESSGPNHDIFGGFPSVSITGGFAMLGGATTRQDSFQHYFAIMDNVSWTHGKHTIKFGEEGRLAYFNSTALTNENGQLSFGSTAAFAGATPLQDFLTGVASSGQILVGDPNRNTQAPFDGSLHSGQLARNSASHC